MSDRSMTPYMLKALIRQQLRVFHLFEFYFDSGTDYLAGAARDLTWNGQSYSAMRSVLSFGDIEESTELRSNTLNVMLSGANQTNIARALLENFIERRVVIRRGILDPNAERFQMVNGFGELGNNTGWSGFTYDATDGYPAVPGCFRINLPINSTIRGIRGNVDIYKRYTLSAALKADVSADLVSLGFTCYDQYGANIGNGRAYRDPSRDTVLQTDAVAGTNIVKIHPSIGANLVPVDLSQWVKTNCTVSNAIAPDGSTQPCLITRTAIGDHFLSAGYTGANAGNSYAEWVWLKAGTMIGNVVLRIRNTDSSVNVSVSITLTASWVRYSVSALFPGGSTPNVNFIINPANDTGVAGDTFYAFVEKAGQTVAWFAPTNSYLQLRVTSDDLDIPRAEEVYIINNIDTSQAPDYWELTLASNIAAGYGKPAGTVVGNAQGGANDPRDTIFSAVTVGPDWMPGSVVISGVNAYNERPTTAMTKFRRGTTSVGICLFRSPNAVGGTQGMRLGGVSLQPELIITDPVVLFDGRIDSWQIAEDISQGAASVTWVVASHWVDFERTAGRRTNSEDQQVYYPGDRGLEFATDTSDFKWGKAA